MTKIFARGLTAGGVGVLLAATGSIGLMAGGAVSPLANHDRHCFAIVNPANPNGTTVCVPAPERPR